jgi:hypothetical protein
MNAFALTVMAVGSLLLVRNELVFRHSMRRLQAIHEANLADIESDDFFQIVERRYAGIGSHVLMLLDLRRWTYKQFYPSEAA